MALVPEATFVVGAATREAVTRGSPTRVEAFCLDRLEVTTEAFAACVASGRCTAPLKGGSCSFERSGAERRPINCVGVLQADAFCKARGKRLPSEAEWQSAAGASVSERIRGGDEPPGKGVCWDGAENALGYGKRHDSCEVGTFAGDVTPQGVLDLGGNLSEWTAPADSAVGKDPNQLAVRRGGSWGTKAGTFLLRTTSRRIGDYKEYDTGIFTGFRCALDLTAPPPSP
jgi:sulfatase modifying factor 1